VVATGEEYAQGNDRRFFYHQDRNWNVVALTEYTGDGVGTNGRVVERCTSAPYGTPSVLAGNSGAGETGALRLASRIGSVFAIQGLPHDLESLQVCARHRYADSVSNRYLVRDPFYSMDSAPGDPAQQTNLYAVLRSNPLGVVDPLGLFCAFSWQTTQVFSGGADCGKSACIFTIGPVPPWSRCSRCEPVVGYIPHGGLRCGYALQVRVCADNGEDPACTCGWYCEPQIGCNDCICHRPYGTR
jgi:hypothetical protein